MHFSFLHAADLHLGSPFLGLSSNDEELAHRVAAASREAFGELVDQAISRQVKFVVIAGDIYDGDWKDTTIGHFFNRQMARLQRAGIPVYKVRGNHDAESVITSAVTLPDSVKVFSSRRPETFLIPELKVALHGQSFANRAVPENLALTYPAPEPGMFNIGVLHTSCDGRPPHANYAPCSVQDLLRRGYQYWALGHCHEYEVVNTIPPVIFPGNLQGRSIRECGPKGAVIVELEDGQVSSFTRLHLAKIQWALISADLSEATSETEAFEAIRREIQKKVEQAGSTPVVFRMILSGSTPLHRMLHAEPGRLVDEVLAAANHCSDAIWLESVKVQTTQPVVATAGQDSPLAAIDLKTMLDSLRESPEVLTEARAAMESIKGKLLATEGGWRAEWNEVLPAMHLPPDTSVEGAEKALEIWAEIPAALNQRKDRTARVHGMERDMLGFQTRTAALLAQLNEPDLGLGPEAAIKAVAQRLNQAQQVETQAKEAGKRFKELGQQVLLAETTSGEAVCALEVLCEGIPPSPNRIQQVLELEEREKVLERLKERRQTLKPLSRGQTEAELRQGLEAFDETVAGAEIEALKTEEAQHNQRENEIYTSLTNAGADLTRLESGVGAEVAVQLRKNAEAELLQNTHDWAVKRFAQILLAHAIEQHRSQQEQPLLKKASHLFSMLTANSFAGVEQELDESDTFRLVGRRDADHTLGYAEMSEGTQFQLYLALRLAYLDEYAQKAEPMPFIGDDLLASFDDERTRRGVKALAEIGTRIQPILFTHHSRVVELAREELGDRVDVVNLD